MSKRYTVITVKHTLAVAPHSPARFTEWLIRGCIVHVHTYMARLPSEKFTLFAKITERGEMKAKNNRGEIKVCVLSDMKLVDVTIC